MKATELRIGNFIYDDNGVISKVIGFQSFGHSVRCDEPEGCYLLIDIYPPDGSIMDGYEIEINHSKPIPLTSEFLIKSGFGVAKPKIGVARSFTFKHINTIRINLSNSGNFYYGHKFVDSVHELQNLVYATTGEELKAS